MPNVDYTSIRPNQYVLVAGTLVWSRVASQVAGEELAALQRQRSEQGRPAPNRPYTTVTLVDPMIVQADKNQPLTVEERYIKEKRFYTPNNGRNAGHVCFSPQNSGNFLPAIMRKGNAEAGENPKQFYQVHINKEIASGTKVLVLMRSFAGQMNHNGIAMNAVIVLDDHINFYGENSANAEALARWGLVVNNAQPEEPSAEEQSRIAEKTVNVSKNAPIPMADNNVPAQDDDDQTTDGLWDENITSGIGIDALLGE